MLIDWHLMISSLHMLMLRFRVMLLRLVHWKLFFTITYRADFMSSQGVVECIASTYMTKNAHVERHRFTDFSCSHIIAACQHRCVDFRLFVQSYYTTQSYYDTWASLFHPIFNEDEWPLYDGFTIIPPESMKQIGSGRPRSTLLHNEMDVREGKTTITCGLCKQPGHNRRSCKKFSDRCEILMYLI